MNKCHVAVVGVGSFGRHHVRHLSAHPEIERVTVVDRDVERARVVAALHDVDVADDIAGLTIDAAVITVPTEYHAAVAGPLLDRGIHCFIEKPVASEAHEARALLAAAETSGAVLQVGHIERFSPVFEALAEATGPVGYFAARRHNMPRPVPPTVDVVLDIMIHDIDLALALIDAPVAQVTARAPDGIGHECAAATLEFANGAVAELSASRLSPVTERTLIAYDDKGVWFADLADKTLHRAIGGDVHEIGLDTERDALATELSAFVDAAFGRTTPRVGGTAGQSALAVANEIRAALAPLSLQLTA
ncbi:MAG: Gfo/Idh/MocA family oxidoreductase [Acuticoccus sp.]